jgi:two-component system response regulator YesN
MRPRAADQSVPSILIVEDERLTRSVFRTALQPIAHVLEAEDGERALEILQSRAGDAIDLMLLDQVLPGRSGLELLQISRSKWPSIVTIMVTGFSSEELAVQALRRGARDYLKKPVSLDALLRTVHALLNETKPASEVPSGHPSICRALVYIERHFSEEITLEDIAREAGLSRYHFCRLFRHETGSTFLEYLQSVRVRQAQALLADPYLRITEVAYTVGFGDLSHFDRTFRRMVGLSPREYRASLNSV